MARAKIGLSPVAAAYDRCSMARDTLHEVGRCMEVTEDKAGIVWERWVIDTTAAQGKPSHVSVILFATPHYWDVFSPVSESQEIAATLNAIKALKGAA